MNNTWKRETPIQNIAFIAMMAAVNGALSLILSFLPVSAFGALLVLPCINALGIYLVKPKWIAVYAPVALAIPLLVTAYDISTTLFYVIPSIASGLIYGGMSKFKCPVALTIFACSLFTLGATYLTIPLIKAIYEIDMIPSMLITLGKADSTLALSIVPSILFVYSWASVSINHLVMIFVQNKLGFETRNYLFEEYLYPLLTVLTSYGSIRLASVNTSLTYIFFSISLFFMVFTVPVLLRKLRYYCYIILIATLVIAFFLFAIFAKNYTSDTVISLATIFFDAVSLSSLIAAFSKKQAC